MPDDAYGPRSIFRPTGLPESSIQVRLPPASPEAEAAFLGALLANNKVADRAQFLRCEHFADPVNARIYQEATRLIEDSRIADCVTLKGVFEESGALKEVGGTAYLTSLLTAMVGIVNAGDYARVVRDTWVRRQLIDIGEIMVNDAFGADQAVDPIKVAMDAVGMIDRVTLGSRALTENSMSLDEAMGAALSAMWQAQQGVKVGISTGFRGFDTRLGGLEPGLVYVLAGRPGSGKSSLGHCICINAARDDVPVLELSLEMSALQLGRRSLAVGSGVPLSAIRRGNLTVEQADKVVAARREPYSKRIIIDDAGGQTPRMIAAKVRAAKRKHGIKLLMLDHLNLTRADDAEAKYGPTHATSQAMHMMLQIAKDNDLAALVLVQLNRGPENREDHRPNLADLRQSGAIEEDAYAVGFVYRAEYYMGNAPEQGESEAPDRYQTRHAQWQDRRAAVAGKADLIWAKVRDGSPGTDSLEFDNETTRFSELWGPG